jgi:prevent-host-death family protein
MTTSGHNWTMKQVRIADLKARLSEHLRAVRAGESIAVLDRDTPIAQLIPIREPRTLRVRKPAPGSPPPHRIKVPKRAPLEVDIVELLLEERQGQR